MISFITKIKEDGGLDFGSDFNYDRFKKYCSENPNTYLRIEREEIKGTPKLRTQSQNSALWLFYEMLAKQLNEMGLDMRVVLKPSYNLLWTKDSIHDNLWIPFQKALYKTTSTTKLKKQEQIDKIHELLMRELGEKFGVEYVPFPVDELKQSQKLSYDAKSR